MRVYDLEDRLVRFSTSVVKLKFESDYSAQHLKNQLIRSATSPALNYGEAQSSESTRDFLHKMKICLKELRETNVNLKMIKASQLARNITDLDQIIKEANELTAIFVSSIRTAESKKFR